MFGIDRALAAMQRLECHVKKYNWGKRGTESEVARLFAAGHRNFEVDEDETYAELWMGTHPDGPAVLSNSATRLSSFIAKSHSAGYLSNNNWKEDIHLPFIMKVMSIARSLSLQVHPNKLFRHYGTSWTVTIARTCDLFWAKRRIRNLSNVDKLWRLASGTFFKNSFVVRSSINDVSKTKHGNWF
ncbi:hypothetical protein TELCIR_01947 [Teladorsagia circumcincta]|uniref:Phosphomannose isomerase type I catalytic domain-containing protein n=1 Tax=Teladorsagia circumcincta TaxID=45464 RepID=A0A2G9V0S3_TELCI|nr:hypothetical protein TELCIR_01947 [Teladorsagia circumcincta]